MGAGRIRILGTGSAFHPDGRGSPGVLLEPASGTPWLVDCGPTALAALHGAGVETARIGGLFLTHLHGDHTAGWPFLLLDMALRARRRTGFAVVGPPGTRRDLDGLVRHTYAHALAEPGFPLEFVEVPGSEADERPLGAAPAAAILPMRHGPGSIGWRFRCAGADGEAQVAVSGDTGWCPNLERLADGADVLVLECTTVEPETATHVSLRELRERVGTLRARRIVLVHLSDAVAEAIAVDPVPRVETAFDGLVLEF